MCDEEQGYDDQFDEGMLRASRLAGQYARPTKWPRSTSEMRDQTVFMDESIDDRDETAPCGYRLSTGARATTRGAPMVKSIARKQIASGDRLDDDTAYSNYRNATASKSAPRAQKISGYSDFGREGLTNDIDTSHSEFRIATMQASRAAADAAAKSSYRNQVFTM